MIGYFVSTTTTHIVTSFRGANAVMLCGRTHRVYPECITDEHEPDDPRLCSHCEAAT